MSALQQLTGSAMCLSLGDTRLGASVQWERGWGSKGQRLSAQSSQMTEGKWDSPGQVVGGYPASRPSSPGKPFFGSGCLDFNIKF